MRADFLISDDPIDRDVAIIQPVSRPTLVTVPPAVEGGQNLDQLLIPADLGLWDTINNGADSYQPISFILLTHARPLTRQAQRLRQRLAQLIDPATVGRHYLGAAWDQLAGAAGGKSYPIRRLVAHELEAYKILIPLHRAAHDLWPRGHWLLGNNSWPEFESHHNLHCAAGLTDLVSDLETWFSRLPERAAVESLDEWVARAKERLERWPIKEYHREYINNLKIMSDR